MTSPASLAFPNGKTLAAWWRQVQTLCPTALWVGRLFLTRVEALVHVERTQTLEPLAQLTLEALALEEKNLQADAAAQLVKRLHLPEPICRAVLRRLHDDGLVNGSQPSLTSNGRAALRQGAVKLRHWERRQFLFLECLDAAGTRRTPLRPLPPTALHGQPWNHDCSWSAETLRSLLQSNPAAADGCGISDVCAIADDAAPADLPAWQRVMLVRPEQVVAALAIRGETAHVLSAASESASLHASNPLDLPASVFPDVVTALGPDALPAAWRGWTQQRRLVSPHLEGCTFNLTGTRLEVTPPPLLLPELRVRSIRPGGDDWVLIGSGWLRRAAQVHVLGLEK